MPPKCVLIVGSADRCCDSARLTRATEFARAVAGEVIDTGNSVAVLATREPVRDEGNRTVPLSFDWEVLRAVDSHLERRADRARFYFARVFMGADSMEKRFTSENARLIQRLQVKGAIDVRHIEEDLYSGGEYRDWQAEHCDAMIAIGGGAGTYQIADKMLSLGKPVMPMDIRIGARHRDGGGSLQLIEEMKSDEKLFLPRSHHHVNDRLYALSLEKPYWNTQRIAYTTAHILHHELEDFGFEGLGFLGRAKGILNGMFGKVPQVAQSSFHASRTAETIQRLFD